jgi:hypothetical protein
MTLTPNSRVSRAGTIRAEAGSLATALRRSVLDNPSNPVRALFTEDGVSIWTHDIAKTVQLIMTNASVNGLKVKEPVIMLIDPDSMAGLLDTKFSREMIQIEVKPNAPLVIKSRTGGDVVYHPADEDDCFVVPDHWIMPKDSKGWFLVPMKNNEPCSTRVTVSKEEMKRGLVDMLVAGAPYVSFDFQPTGSTCASGHWGAKGNRASSPISAKVEGSGITLNFTENLGGIISRMDGDTFVVQKHHDTPFVIIESGSTVVVATEAQREG